MIRPDANTPTSRERCATAGGAPRVVGETVCLRFSRPLTGATCLRECLRHSGEPAASVRVYLTCGLKIPVSVVRFRPWAPLFAEFPPTAVQRSSTVPYPEGRCPALAPSRAASELGQGWQRSFRPFPEQLAHEEVGRWGRWQGDTFKPFSEDELAAHFRDDRQRERSGKTRVQKRSRKRRVSGAAGPGRL